MQNVVNTVKGTALGVAGFFTPVLKESRFKQTGVVTPSEFVIAGDHLVHTCPTWEWANGDDCKIKSYLPKNKQFLITRNVPCLRRYKHIENCEIQEKIVELEEGSDGWVEAFHFDSSAVSLNGKISKKGLKNVNGASPNQIPINESTGNHIELNYNSDIQDASIDDYDSVAIDMDEFVESGLLEDESAIVDTEHKKGKHLSSTSINEILKTRTYDLYITYDKFYQTPRLWLCGYNEDRIPLSVKEMYDDVSQDYAKKTVTMESHPHIPGPPMASIHPCKHARVMKKLIKMVTKGGKNLKVHMYLIIFLKFVQSVIPTIDYDYTQNINL